MLISQLMTTEFASELEMTRRLLARVPQDKLQWQPAPTLHTVSWNAGHIVEIVSWMPGIINNSEWDISPVGGEPYVAPLVTEVNAMLEDFDRNTASALAAFQDVQDGVMDELWSLKMGGQTFFTMPKGACLRKWVFSHLAHHRGILSVYLRMAGVEFPSIYEE